MSVHFNGQIATYEENSDSSSLSASFIAADYEYTFDFLRVSKNMNLLSITKHYCIIELPVLRDEVLQHY